MDIEVKSTNHKFYNLPSDLSALLLDAFPSVFSRVIREPAAQAVGAPPLPSVSPTFSVGLGLNSQPAIYLKMPGGECFPFQGPPSEANGVWRVFRGIKLKPSQEILQRYKAMYDASRLSVGGRS
jgi:hypothetical protein